MPPRASTSQAIALTSSVPHDTTMMDSTRGQYAAEHDQSQDHDMANLSSADEDELEGGGGVAATTSSRSTSNVAGMKGRAGASAGSASRRSASSTVAAGESASPLSGGPNNAQQDDSATANMTKEEAALADRRRRNRETQRAIRKKKANRLQDAEVRVSLFESEIEKLKVRLREIELENIGLRRELEEWKSGRIQAAVPMPIASASSAIPLPLHHQHQHRYHEGRRLEDRSSPYSPYLASSAAAASVSGEPYQQQQQQQQQQQRQHNNDNNNKNFVPYARQSYQSYDATNILGKRKSFDQHAQAQHTPPSIAVVRSPPFSHRGVGGDYIPGSNNTTTSPHSFSAMHLNDSNDNGNGTDTPSVLQPMQQSPRSIEGTSPRLAHQEGKHQLDSSHLSTLDTEEGSYGGSDPSPSSAGTVRPSYSSAFGGPAILSDALRSARFDEPRGRSTPSTSASMSEESSGTGGGGNKPSYDDYNDIWTSASNSNSQSQSDSLTSLSSYSRGASSSALNGPAGGAGSGAGAGQSQYGQNAAGQAIGADGMILSMSRQSLCASPLSMAMSPGDDKDDHIHNPAKRASVDPEIYQQQQRSSHNPNPNQRLPSLPSLSSSLGRAAQLLSNSKTIDRTVSMPASAPYAVSPTHYYAALHSASGAGNPRTLPPIHAALMGTSAGGGGDHYQHSRTGGMPLSSSNNSYEQEAGLPPPPPFTNLPPNANLASGLGKPPFTTRNGRGKSTSYPLAGHSTIYEGRVPVEMMDRAGSPTSGSLHHDDIHGGEPQLKWPGPAALGHNPILESAEIGSLRHHHHNDEKDDAISPYDHAGVPLPHRAATRPPVSSARGDIDTSPPPANLLTRKSILNDDQSPLQSPVMSAEPESAIMDEEISPPNDEMRIKSEGISDRSGRPRRKSTYEDFVELFGSQPSAAEH